MAARNTLRRSLLYGESAAYRIFPRILKRGQTEG